MLDAEKEKVKKGELLCLAREAIDRDGISELTIGRKDSAL